MIEVKFFYRLGFCEGFNIYGHAGFSEAGKDIVCAGVSSAVQMCINGITEVVKADVYVSVKDNEIFFKTKDKLDIVQFFLQALRLHLESLQNDYKENVKLYILEEN